MSNSDQKTVISGPFGRYEHGSVGALLNACCEIDEILVGRSISHPKYVR